MPEAMAMATARSQRASCAASSPVSTGPMTRAQRAAGRETSGVPATPEAVADYVIDHYEAMLALYGAESGLRQLRHEDGGHQRQQLFEFVLPAGHAMLRRRRTV